MNVGYDTCDETGQCQLVDCGSYSYCVRFCRAVDERYPTTLNRDKRTADLMDMLSQMFIVVFDRLVFDINRQCYLHLLPGQSSLCADHPS